MEITRHSLRILPAPFNEILSHYPGKHKRPHYSSRKASPEAIAEGLDLYSDKTKTTKRRRTSTNLSYIPLHRIRPSPGVKSAASVAEDTELSAATG
ncbi:hypothetical protein EUGRSUZ_G02424 [Eucalyptus grandis]|uniref:Uncharacterized protein n=2 Tax=Eucalyptus grandis TaxID=71139 RepID=A0ACC3K681_EUCGR|nr:hypothetical protein EUGRSUZ_G02424 [Eucalyptus grandis]